MIDIDAIEKVAREATPGPWEMQNEFSTSDNFIHSIYPKNHYKGLLIARCNKNGMYDVDTEFIVTCNPTNIILLCAEVRRLRIARNDALEKAANEAYLACLKVKEGRTQTLGLRRPAYDTEYASAAKSAILKLKDKQP
jgi:hypothetical protein